MMITAHVEEKKTKIEHSIRPDTTYELLNWTKNGRIESSNHLQSLYGYDANQTAKRCLLLQKKPMSWLSSRWESLISW